MNVQANEVTSEVWTRWQGQVINGAFPLGRFLGCSDHSGVFLTKSAEHHLSQVAIKLVPADRSLAESQLPRWKRAGRLAHPHLLRMFAWGGCQLDGLPYLYNVMEYADQTLAQLLLHRALTEDEAREMLLPILDALAFLHGRNLVHGQLKPTNILVVGDQLKLATDTIRRVREGKMGRDTPPMHESADRQGSYSTAGDIRALGVSLFEALTRRPPAGLGDPTSAVVLPSDFSPGFRDVVTRCLNPRPQDRPGVAELVAWAGGSPLGPEPPATLQPVVLVPPEPSRTEPAPPRTASQHFSPAAARTAPSVTPDPKPRGLLTLIVGAVVILALVWAGVSLIRSHRTPVPPPLQGAVGSLSETPAAAPAAAAQVAAPVSAVSTTKPARSDAGTLPVAIDEVIPDVSPGARRTIRGHVKVWVRVIVDQSGAVSAAALDRTGPSQYFQRLAIEAAKQWTFPPADTPSRRLMQVRFDFSRDGTSGRAVTLH
jgi:outer membrane biosynthesis protein TonB